NVAKGLMKSRPANSVSFSDELPVGLPIMCIGLPFGSRDKFLVGLPINVLERRLLGDPQQLFEALRRPGDLGAGFDLSPALPSGRHHRTGCAAYAAQLGDAAVLRAPYRSRDRCRGIEDVLIKARLVARLIDRLGKEMDIVVALDVI